LARDFSERENIEGERKIRQGKSDLFPARIEGAFIDSFEPIGIEHILIPKLRPFRPFDMPIGIDAVKAFLMALSTDLGRPVVGKIPNIRCDHIDPIAIRDQVAIGIVGISSAVGMPPRFMSKPMRNTASFTVRTVGIRTQSPPFGAALLCHKIQGLKDTRHFPISFISLADSLAFCETFFVLEVKEYENESQNRGKAK
jgi:hypothetical protein